MDLLEQKTDITTHRDIIERMALQSRTTFLLLVILGAALLWTAAGIDGPETNTVYQYSAFEVTHDDDLLLTNKASDETFRGTSANIDENIVCLPSTSRECTLTSKEYGGDINATGSSTAFRYAYLDGEFYRITPGSTPRSPYEYEQTNATVAFDELALSTDRITDTERAVLKNGEHITTRPIPHSNRLVEYEENYYTITSTGNKVYGDTGTMCSSSGDGFCEKADRYRYQYWLPRLGFGGLGVIGILVGSRGLLGVYWPD